MSYKEYKDHIGFYKIWENNDGCQKKEELPSHIQYDHLGKKYEEQFHVAGVLHRDSGPAHIIYNVDELVESEFYHQFGIYIGYDKQGFWALWKSLNDEKRQNINILKYLVKYL